MRRESGPLSSIKKRIGSVTVDTITGAISGSVTVTGTTGQPTIAHLHLGGVGAAPVVATRVEQSGADAINTDGTRFFVQGLTPNTTFDFTVSALDGSDNELASESIQLTTSDDAFIPLDEFEPLIGVENLRGNLYSSYTYTVTPQSGGVAETMELATRAGNGSTNALDLVGQVYSVSALELFWSRVSGAARDEVQRDGSIVAEIDALSFFDSGLAANTNFSHTVRAFAGNGDVIVTETLELITQN